MLVSSPSIDFQSNSSNQTILDEQLDWLTIDHDDLREDLLQQMVRPKYHPSMTIIDTWEKETIERIQQIAIHARRTLIHASDQHVLEVNNALDKLTPKLREARNSIKSFNENDIKQWASTLRQLKQTPAFPVTIDQDNYIYGLKIDLSENTETHGFESKFNDSTLDRLISIIHGSTRTITENVVVKTTVEDKKTIKADGTSSNKSQIVTKTKPVISAEPTIVNTTHLRRANPEIPFD